MTKLDTKNSVIALTEDANEIIIVNDSQPTEEIYKHILYSKNEVKSSNLPINLRTAKNMTIECEYCKEVNYFFNFRYGVY